MKVVLLASLLSLALSAGCPAEDQVLLSESFENLDNWHLEGLENAVTLPAAGEMRLDCTGSKQGSVGAMAFCRRDFPDNIAIEYDLVVENHNGLLITFLAMQGLNGEDAITGVPPRTGVFNDYVGDDASTRSYHASICRYDDAGKHTGVSNWRRNPGLHLMTSGKDLCTETGKKYHVKITKRGPRCRVEVDGAPGAEFTDPQTLPGPIPTTGKIGFRAIGAKAVFRISNLKVTGLAQSSSEFPSPSPKTRVHMLDKRPFGNTGLLVSPLTFGAWSIGGPAEMGGRQVGWSGVNDEESVDALKAAYDAGINLFDTADAYGRGHSEELLARAFKGTRDKILISSKAGMIDNPDGFKLDFSRNHLTEACEASLRRLQTDRLDIYFLHMVIDGYPLTDEIRATLDDLHRAGKVRHYGVSVQFPHQGMEQLDKSFGDSMMIEYSPLKRSGVEAVLERAKQQGVGVITRGALEKGLLSGKYRAGHRFPADDVRSRLPGDYIDRVLTSVAQLQSQAARENWSLLGMALRFQLAHPGCSTITVGMKTRRQVEENVAALRETHRFDWPRIIAALETAK